MEAGSICSPVTYTVHRLRTTASCTGLVVVGISAAVTVVCGILADLVESASPVLVVIVAFARSIWIPRTNTINRLSALLSGALLKLVSVWASISVVGSRNRDLVQSAALVLVGFLVMVACSIHIPSSNTVHWLSTSRNSTLLILVSKWASISVVG